MITFFPSSAEVIVVPHVLDIGFNIIVNIYLKYACLLFG